MSRKDQLSMASYPLETNRRRDGCQLAGEKDRAYGVAMDVDPTDVHAYDAIEEARMPHPMPEPTLRRSASDPETVGPGR
jgi:hypothetical protein